MINRRVHRTLDVHENLLPRNVRSRNIRGGDVLIYGGGRVKSVEGDRDRDGGGRVVGGFEEDVGVGGTGDEGEVGGKIGGGDGENGVPSVGGEDLG